MDKPKVNALQGHDTETHRIPRLVRLLDRIVSANAPGGRVAWKGSRKKIRDPLPPKEKAIKVSTDPVLDAQSSATKAILSPNGILIRREVAQFSLSMLLCIEESFPRFFDQVPFDSQLSLIKTANSWPKDEFVKTAKGLTVWAFARLMKDVLPEVKNPQECRNLGFSGKAAQWIRNLLVRRSNPRNQRFCWALLQGVKRGCAPIDEEFISKAFEKHKKSLTKPLGNPEFDDSELWKFGHRLWKGAKLADELPPPSFKASFHSSRASGGKLAEIRNQHLGCPPAPDAASGLVRPVDWHRLDPGNSKELTSKLKEVALISEGTELRRAEAPVMTLEEAVSNYLQGNDRKRARVEMIAEPLKARPITAGSAMGGWVSMIGQKTMHDHLKKFKQFELIGQPLAKSHLDWIEANSPSGFDHWVSGDYSAATDNLDIRVTKRLFESFTYWCGISDDLEIAWKEMLYEHELVYPDGSCVNQTTGQLMGSALSFPILCAANLFCYAETWRKVCGTRRPLKDLPVLINGDDILFKANPEFYAAWQREVKKVGFELSVGKSYFSRNFLTVNSKLYVCRRGAAIKKSAGLVDGSVNKCDVKTLIDFFHPGLVLPFHYLTKEEKRVEEGTPEDPLIGRLSEALRRSRDPEWAWSRFKWFNQHHLRKATQDGRLNCFVHRNLGGLGVDPSGVKFKLTRFQHQLATKLHSLQQVGVVSLTSSVTPTGLIPVEPKSRAVRATVPPAPGSCISQLGRDFKSSGLPFWKIGKIPSFGKLRAKDAKLLNEDFIRNYVGTTEIAPTDENEEILINCEWAKSIGLQFGRIRGSVAGVKATPI